MRILKFLIVFILLIIGTSLTAQFSVNAELRPRFEMRNGYKQLPDTINTPAFITTQRSRLIFNYKKEKLSTCISFQDVRVWGSEKSLSANPDMSFPQAWFAYELTNFLTFKAGRQELMYDNSRLLGNANWNQNGLTHDALLLKFRIKKWQIDLGNAFNQNNDNLYGTDYSGLSKNNYKALSLLWVSKSFERLKISSLNIADGYQKIGTSNTTYLRITTGGIIDFTEDYFSLSARAFKQTGKNSFGQNIDAFLICTNASAKLHNFFKLYAGFEMKSGDDAKDSTNNKDKAFDVLYGSTHSFNGSMDYFSKPATTKNAGLNDFFGGMSFMPSKKINFKIDYHYFMLNNNYIVNSSVIDKYLASEIDFDMTYAFAEETSLSLGVSALKANKSLEYIKGGKSDKICYWAFVMLTVKPELFSFKP